MTHRSSFLTVAAVGLALSAPAWAGGGHIPVSVVPFQEPERWPYAVETTHTVVHYAAAGDRGMAESVAADLEFAWQAQIDELGAAAPLDDGGLAGPDGRLDVYLWRGIDTFYVEAVADNPATWWDDVSTYMVLDPWGKYGGPELAANLYHELRHTSQAVDDWWEDYPVFEAEATLWESRAFGFARLAVVWSDYQAHPDWSPFRDDAYRTWFMYGGALYFDFVSRRYFGGELGFSNQMWQLCRNPPGAELDPLLNEPDFADALDHLLRDEGASFLGSIVEFARARWYTGARDLGLFSEGAVLPQPATRVHDRGGGSARSSVRLDAMLLGTAYVTVVRGPADPPELVVSLKRNGRDPVTFAVQTVGRGSADAILDLDGRTARVRFGPTGTASLAVTVMPPAGGVYDPDLAGDTRYSVDLVFDRR